MAYRSLISVIISDHAIIMSWLCLCKPELSVETITYKNLKLIDLNSFRSDLKNSVLCQFQDTGDKKIADLDAIVCDYNTILSTGLERHASALKLKLKFFRPTVPWYNDEIDCGRRLRGKADRKRRRTRRTEDLKVFKAKRNCDLSPK